jgi:hypothetical protein
MGAKLPTQSDMFTLATFVRMQQLFTKRMASQRTLIRTDACFTAGGFPLLMFSTRGSREHATKRGGIISTVLAKPRMSSASWKWTRSTTAKLGQSPLTVHG